MDEVKDILVGSFNYLVFVFVFVFLIFTFVINWLGGKLYLKSLFTIFWLLIWFAFLSYISFFMDVRSIKDIGESKVNTNRELMDQSTERLDVIYGNLLAIQKEMLDASSNFNKINELYVIEKELIEVKNILDAIDGSYYSYTGERNLTGFIRLDMSIDNSTEILKAFDSLFNEYSKVRATSISKEVKLDKTTEESNYLSDMKYFESTYFSIRALSLGALGALISMVLLYYVNKSDEIHLNHVVIESVARMMVGAIVSIVVFSLFYTKQISIFNQVYSDKELSIPEFWRVTMLCLFSGGYSAKLYKLAEMNFEKVSKAKEEKNIS